jgi:hypothetical protein
VLEDKPSWLEKTGYKRPAKPGPPVEHLHLVKEGEPQGRPHNEDDDDGGDYFDPGEPDEDGFYAYTAVQTVLGRKAEDACFVAGEVPDGSLWRLLLHWRGSRRHNLICLWFPGLRIEIEGKRLRPVYRLIMTRRAGIWQEFDPKRHREPGEGEPKITKIKIEKTE